MEHTPLKSSTLQRIGKRISGVINFARPEYIDLGLEQERALQQKYREEGRAAFFGIGSTGLAVVAESSDVPQHEQDLLTYQD